MRPLSFLCTASAASTQLSAPAPRLLAVLAILSSSNPTGGPYTCVGSNDDDSTCAQTTSSSLRGIQVTKDTYYFFVVAHINPTSVYFYQLYVTANLDL